MTIKDLIRRSLNGEMLNPAERAELENFDPELLRQQLSNAQEQLETLENEKLSHSERLQKELDSLKQEHSALNQLHNNLQRQCKIDKITAASGCTDPGYFDFLAGKCELNLDDQDAVTEFIADMAKKSPGCFQARISPGSAGNPAAELRRNDHNALTADRISRIMDSLNSAPAANL